MLQHRPGGTRDRTPHHAPDHALDRARDHSGPGRARADRHSIPFIDGITRRSTIRRILLLILCMALLPLMLLTAWQGLARLDRDAQQQRQELERAAALTTRSDQNVMRRTEAMLQLLARNPEVRSGAQDRCAPVLKSAQSHFPGYAHLGRMAADGTLSCATNPAALGMPLENPGIWAKLKDGGFAVMPPAIGPFSGRPILAAALPLQKPDGSFDGVLVASIDLEWTAHRLIDRTVNANVIVTIVDSRGRPVAGSEPLPWPEVPLSGEPGRAHSADADDGQPWAYAFAPLHTATSAGESFHVVFAAPQPRRFGSEWWFVAGFFLLPLVALLLASAAIWIGANRAILRWIGRLGDVAVDIGQGTYRHHGDVFANAPREIRGLAAELYQMARVIDARDRTLVESAEQQRGLALEVHHRVRNNLQILGSFLSLQADGLPPGQARRALEDARLRVSALGLVHRLLYDSGELTTISAAAVLAPLSELISAQPSLAGKVDVVCDLQDHPVTIDVAVPLTLWLVEASTLLLDRGLGSDARACLMLSLRETQAGIDLLVEATGLAAASPADGLRRRLVDSIARQLGGAAHVDDSLPDRGSAELKVPHTTLVRNFGARARKEQSPDRAV